MWEKDFEEFMRGSILGLAKAAAGLIEQAFSVGALTPEWWVTVVGGQVTTTVAGGESTVIDHPGMLNVIVLAMIPLSRSVFFGPMAVAIMGGLIVATALTLLFLPALYAAWFRVKKEA